jgi:hypothetical protein
MSSTHPSSSCKDQSCAYNDGGSYVQLPAYNWGSFPGLSFSLWYKCVSVANGNDQRLLDFGNGDLLHNIAFGRSGGTTKMTFFIVSPSKEIKEWVSAANVWVVNEWRHVTWSLAPSTRSGAQWRIYIDGVLSGALTSIYVADRVLDKNFLTKSSSPASAVYAGYIDSVYIYPVAISSGEAAQLFAVSLCAYTYIHRCMCVYVYVNMICAVTGLSGEAALLFVVSLCAYIYIFIYIYI